MLQYPHLFINQLTIDAQPDRFNETSHHWIVSYLANVRYHVAENPALVTGSLQQQLDDASIKMIADLTSITWEEIPVELKNRRTEKVDGVLHFFANITIMAKKPIEIDPNQARLTTNTHLKEYE